jgi:hypothetical protein
MLYIGYKNATHAFTSQTLRCKSDRDLYCHRPGGKIVGFAETLC